jgi:hypothetical protein
MIRSAIIIFIGIFLISCSKPATHDSLKPGEPWLDADGKPINAHGGGILYDNGTYYWYGEIKTGTTWRVKYINNWECYRTNAGGVSCYSSKDLVHWKYEGVALAPVMNDSTQDLHFSKVIERPKVIFNEKTGKYVMWMHLDSENYLYAHAGVAVSDKPQGPFTFLGSMRPNDQMSRDMTLFKDADGRAYHVYSSENNETMYISLLSDDYLKPSGTYTRNFIKMSREAPAVFKRENHYYLISSACTGWLPNAASYAVADSMLGSWKMLGNPCIGESRDTTFGAQSTFVIPLEGKKDAFIFMADRWNKLNLEDSRYVWLPLNFEGDSMKIAWKKEWNFDEL